MTLSMRETILVTLADSVMQDQMEDFLELKLQVDLMSLKFQEIPVCLPIEPKEISTREDPKISRLFRNSHSKLKTKNKLEVFNPYRHASQVSTC